MDMCTQKLRTACGIEVDGRHGPSPPPRRPDREEINGERLR